MLERVQIQNIPITTKTGDRQNFRETGTKNVKYSWKTLILNLEKKTKNDKLSSDHMCVKNK